MTNKILCLDFDGVIHSYTSGWQGADVIPDPPVPGAIPALWSYINHFHVHIFSSRSNQDGGIQAMKDWLYKWNNIEQGKQLINGQDILEFVSFPTEKPPAFVSIDDRCITFNGTFPTSHELLAFQPWYATTRTTKP